MGRDKVGLFGVGGIYGDPPISGGGGGGGVIGSCGYGGGCGGGGGRKRRKGISHRVLCKLVPWLILGMGSVVAFLVMMEHISRMEGDRRESECRSAIQAEIRRIDDWLERDYREKLDGWRGATYGVERDGGSGFRSSSSGSSGVVANGNIRFAGDRVTVGHGEDRGVMGGWREFDRGGNGVPVYVVPPIYGGGRYYDPAPYVPVPYWGGNGGMGYRQGWMPGTNGNAGSWVGTAIPGGGGN